MTASNELLELLHAAVGDNLLQRITSGEATAAEYAQAIKFLKDNSITSAKNKTLDNMFGALKERLPFSDPDDPTQHPH